MNGSLNNENGDEISFSTKLNRRAGRVITRFFLGGGGGWKTEASKSES